MLSVFSAPSHYVQGKHATAALGTEMQRIGLQGPACIVAGKSAIRLLSEVWQKHLNDADITHVVHQFGGECSYPEIERIKETARANKAQVIIGAGGGKVLDAARAAADDLDLPVVNCPSIASSDAPCSALSVIYTPEGVFQEYRFYRKNPDLVVVDTSVVAQAPARLLVAGMGDALATWFEAKTCVAGHVQNMRGEPQRAAPKSWRSCAIISWLKTARMRNGPWNVTLSIQPWSGLSKPTPCCRVWASSPQGLPQPMPSIMASPQPRSPIPTIMGKKSPTVLSPS